MMMIIVIVFEALAIILIGSFARTNDSTSLTNVSSTLVNNMFTLIFGFTLMYCPFRKLSIFSFVTLLIIISITTQTTILFATFWDNCFNSFNTLDPSFQITAALLSRSGYASLAVLLTVLDFIGLFSFWQIYLLIAPIMAIGYCLNSAIIIYGLKTFDGGGGVTIFLYSGMCSLMIWIVCIRGKIDFNKFYIKSSYLNKTLGFIGVVISFINWPKFNMAGSIISFVNVNKTTSTTITVLPSLTQLQNSALGNTFLGLCASLLLSLLFVSKQTKEQKLKYQIYIDCFINGGIIIASYQDVALNPVVCILMASISTIITLIIHKYFLTPSETDAQGIFKKFMIHYAKVVYRIIFSFIGIIIASIVVAARNGISPELLYNNYSKIAGLQIVALIITILFGAIFGVITAASINLFLAIKKKQIKGDNVERQQQSEKMLQISDQTFFQSFHHDELFPLYYDIFETINKKQQQKINIADYTTRVIKQSLLGAQQNPMRIITTNKNNIQQKVYPKDARFIINPDFSKSNFNMQVSKMKSFKREDQSVQSNKQQQIVINPQHELKIQRSHLKITQNQDASHLQNRNIKRKLQYDQGSSILAQDIGKSKVKS